MRRIFEADCLAGELGPRSWGRGVEPDDNSRFTYNILAVYITLLLDFTA
jgi:hypothetical protein